MTTPSRWWAIAVALVLVGSCTVDDSASTSEPRDGQPLLGFNYPVWAPDGYDRAINVDDLDEIAATGAGWVTLSVTWYQPDPGASCPGADPQATVRSEGLRRVIRLAVDRGLEVALKPMVDLPGAADRTAIDPIDPTRWFECYRSLLLDLTDLAEAEGVGLMLIGTELGGTVRHEGDWRDLIAAVRDRYTGKITYGANFTDVEDVEFWDALDLIGVSAYWPLASEPTSDLSVLDRSWGTIIADLEALSMRWDRPILLTELGYRAQQGVTVRPWDWASEAPVDEIEQAAAFESARRSWTGVPWFAGVFIWTWDDVLDASTTPAPGRTYSPNGTRSMPIIRSWFQSMNDE